MGVREQLIEARRDELLTVKEYAALRRVSVKVVYRRIWAGQQPGAQRVGQWRIDITRPGALACRRGRPRKPDHYYAELARDYAIQFRPTLHPVVALARRHGLSVACARRALKVARRLGFLTSPGRGRSNSQLTKRARKVLGTKLG